MMAALSDKKEIAQKLGEAGSGNGQQTGKAEEADKVTPKDQSLRL